MKQNPLRELSRLGQAVWLDYIRRDLIRGGGLQRLIDEDGLQGMTSNPAIFEKAILESDAYDADIRALAARGAMPQRIFEALSVQDVGEAADAFRAAAAARGAHIALLDMPLLFEIGSPGRRAVALPGDDLPPEVDLPALLTDRPKGSALIYLSLGSLGSADVELMRRLVAVLADTPHRYVVSKGPRADEFELSDNMWGEARVPPTNVIPHCDLVITHGGNNTTTEAFHFGKPMIVLPLFWDQYDNAQRVHERGFGVRLASYDFTSDQLRASVASLLGDGALLGRLSVASARIRAADGVGRASELIEGAVRR